jgi:hypothetical protein
MSLADVRWCVACGQQRQPAELIAFWPTGHPDHPHGFVCRPTLNESGRYGQPCFREAVADRSRHEIGAAA